MQDTAQAILHSWSKASQKTAFYDTLGQRSTNNYPSNCDRLTKVSCFELGDSIRRPEPVNPPSHCAGFCFRLS